MYGCAIAARGVKSAASIEMAKEHESEARLCEDHAWLEIENGESDVI